MDAYIVGTTDFCCHWYFGHHCDVDVATIMVNGGNAAEVFANVMRSGCYFATAFVGVLVFANIFDKN